MLPPPFADLIDPDPRRRAFDALIIGRWGLIPVFPWSTKSDIEGAGKKISRAIGRQHSDAKNTHRAQLAIWLSTNRVPASEIARLVWGRRRGLRRRSRAKAIEQITPEEEQRRIQGLMRQGLDYHRAERRLLRQLGALESPASAAVRVAVSRYQRERLRYNEALKHPHIHDRLGFGVTRLLRAVLFGQGLREITRCARAVRDAILEPSSP